MNKSRFRQYVLILLLTLSSAASGCRPKPSIPKNVILMIIDGCGFNHIQAASFYQYGESGRMRYQQFPVCLAASTYPEGGSPYDPVKAWETWDFVRESPTDSAASGTAMACGKKTVNGAVGVDSRNNRLYSVLDRAEEMKKATGVVSSVHFSHATPACFVAHNPKRGRYEEIAREMILTSPVDVIMGCGHPDFTLVGKKARRSNYRFVGGRDVWELLLAGSAGGDSDGDGDEDPWTLIQTREEFVKLMSGPVPSRVIGVPQVFQTLQQQRYGSRHAEPFSVPLNDTVPSLEEMTRAALNVLSQDEDGFFLMVEGGAVDWAAHDNQSGRMIEEMVMFNQAVDAVCDWISARSGWDETLLIITADHETGYLWGPGSGILRPAEAADIREVWRPLENHGKGRMPGMIWYEGSHTNSLVPLYAKGAGALGLMEFADEHDPVRGPYIDNTEIGRFFLDLWK